MFYDSEVRRISNHWSSFPMGSYLGRRFTAIAVTVGFGTEAAQEFGYECICDLEVTGW